ncbi:MAG: DUF3667 domain-containing protein, partial [Proteobacteria bacterium]|nr:DUF3667 domain-containing protein [Pseudomonadota bacterium]
MSDTPAATIVPTTCRNCDAPLTGPYCAQCGQHVHDSARSVGALLHEGWHVLTHVDGRFWATLRLLMARPGQLTLEYFAERRARYAPPVRLYLVISIVFFGLNSLTGHFQPGLSFVDDSGQVHTAHDVDEFNKEIGAARAQARRAAAE